MNLASNSYLGIISTGFTLCKREGKGWGWFLNYNANLGISNLLKNVTAFVLKQEISKRRRKDFQLKKEELRILHLLLLTRESGVC